MSVVYAPQAKTDLLEALNHLRARSPRAAEQLLLAIERLLEQLEARRFDGPFDELKSGESVQSWPMSPYRVYYQRRESRSLVRGVAGGGSGPH